MGILFVHVDVEVCVLVLLFFLQPHLAQLKRNYAIVIEIKMYL